MKKINNEKRITHLCMHRIDKGDSGDGVGKLTGKVAKHAKVKKSVMMSSNKYTRNYLEAK
ncbi:MAG: hypothetical protein CR963_00080 [Gammaproteobacteria bacterium]|nr:MAG: hypothetical protein CR963_00080 [Gammaproteobacteria bacterium]